MNGYILAKGYLDVQTVQIITLLVLQWTIIGRPTRVRYSHVISALTSKQILHQITGNMYEENMAKGGIHPVEKDFHGQQKCFGTKRNVQLVKT